LFLSLSLSLNFKMRNLSYSQLAEYLRQQASAGDRGSAAALFVELWRRRAVVGGLNQAGARVDLRNIALSQPSAAAQHRGTGVAGGFRKGGAVGGPCLFLVLCMRVICLPEQCVFLFE